MENCIHFTPCTDSTYMCAHLCRIALCTASTKCNWFNFLQFRCQSNSKWKMHEIFCFTHQFNGDCPTHLHKREESNHEFNTKIIINGGNWCKLTIRVHGYVCVCVCVSGIYESLSHRCILQTKCELQLHNHKRGRTNKRTHTQPRAYRFYINRFRRQSARCECAIVNF